MTSKKSIFEKLGLVETVEEEATPSEQFDEPQGFFLDPDEDVNAEFEAMLREQEEQSKAVIETVAANEEAFEEVYLPPVKEEEPVKTSAVNQFTTSQPVVEEAPLEIEDRLNVLIGAYEKNKMLSIDDIYRNSRLTADSKRSIFIADVFLKTLPENLPVDIKRNSLLSILNVSAINIEELLTDAFQRIDSLNTVLENTVNTSEEIIKKNEMTIRELESRIEELKQISEVRRKFQEDQNTMIEYEIQRIINIVDFIKPKK